MRRSVFSPAMRVFVRSTHHSMHRFRQSADPFSQNRPFSAFFTQWVCTLATTPPQVVTSPPPNGGNCTIRGATRRRQADSQLLMLQNPQYRQYGSRPTACRPCPQCPRATESHTMEQGWCHGERKLALQESHSPTCGTKLALFAQNGLIWRVLRVQGELSTAAASNKPSRANFLPHQPQHHHGLDRNDAPTRHTKRRNETFSAPAPHTPPQHETFIAPARHKRPKITHFPHAGANYLSQHTPPTQHAPTPGRFFFQPPKASPSEPTVACNSHQAHPDTTS